MSVSGQRICRLAEAASAADSPMAALKSVRLLRREIEDFERQQVARALTAGEPVSAVARALGVTRQSAHRRFRDLLPKRASSRRLRSTPEMRLAVEYARREAEATDAATLGSAHLLLGLLRSGDHPVVGALAEIGVEFETLEAAYEQSGVAAVEEPKAVLAAAARAARAAGADRVGLEHLLLGVLADPDGAAAALLRDVGVERDAAVAAAVSSAGPSAPPRRPRG